MSGQEISQTAPPPRDGAVRNSPTRAQDGRIRTSRVGTSLDGDLRRTRRLSRPARGFGTRRPLRLDDLARSMAGLRRRVGSQRRQIRHALGLWQRQASQFEGALRELEARLQLALEADLVATWDWHVGDDRVNWSPRLEAIHGLAPGRAGGTLANFLEGIHPEDRPSLEQAIRHAWTTGTAYRVQYRIRSTDGRIRWVQARGCPLRGADGRSSRMLGVCVDITDHKWIGRYRESQHDEHHLIKRVDPILAGISALLPSLPQPQADQAADELAKLQTIVRQIQGIDQTLRDQFRQPARDRGSLSWDKLQPCEGVVGSWFAQVPWLILDTEIDVRSHFQLSGDPFWANLAGVLAALRNLQTNAVEAVEVKGEPPYRVVCSARIRRLERDQDEQTNSEYVVLSVADTGAGIPPEIRNRIFQDRILGSDDDCGLGTQIVRRVVDDHHGLIRLATREGVGTLVELWFPRLEDPAGRPLRDQWEPYATIRERLAPVCWIDEGNLLAALNDDATHPDTKSRRLTHDHPARGR